MSVTQEQIASGEIRSYLVSAPADKGFHLRSFIQNLTEGYVNSSLIHGEVRFFLRQSFLG